MKVLVTGGTSLLGAAVADRLAERGDSVTVLQRRPTGSAHREVLADVAAQRGDVRYVDGRELYGELDAEALPLPDGLHPDTAAHRLVGERFAPLLG